MHVRPTRFTRNSQTKMMQVSVMLLSSPRPPRPEAASGAMCPNSRCQGINLSEGVDPGLALTDFFPNFWSFVWCAWTCP